MSFAKDLEKFAQKTQRSMDQVVRATVLGLGKDVIMASPVKTGRFRGNWQHDTGYAPTGTLPTLDQSGTSTIAKLNASVAPVRAGNVEYLVNNLPYAQRLEYGYSQQAPAGMVRIAVARFRSNLAEAVRGIK